MAKTLKTMHPVNYLDVPWYLRTWERGDHVLQTMREQLQTEAIGENIADVGFLSTNLVDITMPV